MFKWAALLGLAGLAAATVMIVWSGWHQVATALAQAGWGIAVIAAFHLISVGVSAAGWRVLIPGKRSPSYPQFIYVMWVRAAVNNLMPVARVGGEFAAVRLMTAQGMRGTRAIAATVVELTLSILAIFLFVLTGVVLFAIHVNGGNMARQLGWGLALTLPLIAALAAVQRIGFFGLLSRLLNLLFRDKWAHLSGGAARLDRAIKALYRRKSRILACFALQFTAWSLGSIEIWIGLRFMGHPLPPLQAVMLEALIQGSASAAFAVPGALGVQEAGFLFFGGMLGLPSDIAAALAVMRRCRDLLCYAPALMIWQAHEGKRLWRS